MSTLSTICAVIALLALADLAIRAAVRLNLRWDTFMYHLPFAALRGGLHIPYDMNDTMRPYYQGFPPLPDLLQGILWRLTGSVNATGVVNYLALIAFLAYCHVVLRAKWWLVALIALTAPLVLIHTTVSYVDLFGNALLAIGTSSCLYVYLFPERASRVVVVGGLAGIIGAAWSKYLLVPVVALVLCLFAIVSLRPSRNKAFSVRQTVLLLVMATSLAALPYLKNFAVYGNPFWPVRVPVLSQLFPYDHEVDMVTRTAVLERPPPLMDYSQFSVFIHSLFEINHPTRYDNRPRWTIDQGNAWIAYRSGGFWVVGVVTYLLATMILLVLYDRKTGIVASIGLLGILCFVAILPRSHDLRYYLFIPLTWAAAVGMLFPQFRKKVPGGALALLVIVVCLFLYMVSENRMHYRISKINYADAAQKWGASEWWAKLQRGQTYCAVGMMPIGILLTGPTMSEYSIIDRSKEALCPDGSVLITKDGIQHVVNHATLDEAAARKSAEDYLNESLTLYQGEKYPESIAACEMALRVRPDYAEAYNNMCAAYNALERWDEGIAACEKAIQLKPDFTLAKNNLAWATKMKAARRK